MTKGPRLTRQQKRDNTVPSSRISILMRESLAVRKIQFSLLFSLHLNRFDHWTREEELSLYFVHSTKIPLLSTF